MAASEGGGRLHKDPTKFNAACQCYQSGDLGRAEALCSEMLELLPVDSDLLNLMGLVFHRSGRNEEAAKFLRKAIRNDRDNPLLYNNLGVILQSSGDHSEALENFKTAIRVKPDYADAYNNLGDSLRAVGEIASAIKCYRKAVRLKPDFSKAINNMGTALHEFGKFDEAILCFKQALKLTPRSAETFYNLGNSLHDSFRFHEAIAAYQKALKLKPDYPQVYNNLGISYKHCGQLEKALNCQQKAIALKPDFSKAHSDLVFAMNYDPSRTAGDLLEAAVLWWELHGSAVADRFFHKRRSFNKKIRVGYVSPDFRKHSVSYFFLPLLRRHNRAEVDIFCYSEVKRPDEATAQIEQLSDRWRSTVGLDDDTVAARIYRDRIDILVDLAGHTADNRLLVFARKPAPVQVSWLGYPGTTGLPTMDYRFTDEIADPHGDSDRYHSETLYRLPRGFLCYEPPENAPQAGILPYFDSGGITFGSFNNLIKMNSQVVSIWSEILLQIPGSRLLLKSRELADASLNRHYFDLFSKRGISPDRIRVVPPEETVSDHLALYNTIDIGLDPFPYNGTTTTCEALWMGVPVVTLAGMRHAGRVGASILSRVGLRELVTHTEKAYVKKAVDLARNPGYLKGLRDTLRSRMARSPLCDANGFAHEIEKIYGAMMEKIWGCH